MTTRHLSGSQRAELHREVRALIESGSSIMALAPTIGMARAHAYRVAKAAGVRRMYLTPDERQIIEARRKSFNL